jgi:hypothetical protein
MTATPDYRAGRGADVLRIGARRWSEPLGRNTGTWHEQDPTTAAAGSFPGGRLHRTIVSFAARRV